MPNLDSCTKCQSRKIIPKVRIIDRADYNGTTNLTVHVYESPDALIFKHTHDGVLSAWICGECGYVETYVDNPGELYEAYQQSVSGQ